jgi:hypothetical protein
MSSMAATPTVDESVAALHRAGWPVGDVRIASVVGARWQVDAGKGGHTIIARAPSQAEA